MNPCSDRNEMLTMLCLCWRFFGFDGTLCTDWKRTGSDAKAKVERNGPNQIEFGMADTAGVCFAMRGNDSQQLGN
jgi:hypothetical protein